MSYELGRQFTYSNENSFPPGTRPLPTKEPQRVEQSQRASSKRAADEHRYNFLSCLAAAQACQIDFVEFMWVDAQPELGRGGQALVKETRASAETILAFKRRSPNGMAGNPIPENDIESGFRELTSEIWVLGQPTVKAHPNIVQLVGICWEFIPLKPDTNKFDASFQAWPVLLFEKAHQGTLEQFIRKHSKDLSFRERLKICREIASALESMHEISR